MTADDSQIRQAIQARRPSADAGPGLDAFSDLILRVITGSDRGDRDPDAIARSVVTLHDRLATRIGSGPMVFVEPGESGHLSLIHI